MKIYLNCTANLGDFLNGLPVISGLVKAYGKVDFIVKSELTKFNGIIEFLHYQDLFKSIILDTGTVPDKDTVLLSSWTRYSKNAKHRPVETSRYENYIRDNYNFDFEVDDSFILKVPDIEIAKSTDKIYLGDRWDTKIDRRRPAYLLRDSDKFNQDVFQFIDYTRPIAYNAALILSNENMFISAVTGISVLADLLNKPQLILYDDQMITWDNRKSFSETYNRHFYSDRNTVALHIQEFKYD